MYDFTEESIKNFYKETEEIIDNLYNEVVEANKKLIAMDKDIDDYTKACLLRSCIMRLIHRMDTIIGDLSNKSNFPFWTRHKSGKNKVNKLSKNEYKYYFEFLDNIMQIKYDIEFSLFAEKEEYIITLYKAEAYFRKIELKNIIENLKKLNKILK